MTVHLWDWENIQRSVSNFQGKIVMFSCSVCKASFLTHEELEKHALEKHSHVCSICGEAFSIKRDLAKHRIAQHKEEVSESFTLCLTVLFCTTMFIK